MEPIFWTILVGMAAGWLAGQLMKGSGFGIFGDILIGITGALVGSVLFLSLGTSSWGGLTGSLIVSAFSAVASLLLLRQVTRA
ncbi:GlsB/YeaQ/YmgE family stress response membrane protein [candidate division KSB1 bacterium]|nr:GlsB/YeaQ/YmgE family stress response membrane protein [candidate division KSB1 bacterium]